MKTRITSLGSGALSSVSAHVGSSFLCPYTTPNLPYLCKHINTDCLLTLWCISLLSTVLTLTLHNNFETTFLDSLLGPPSVSQLCTESCLSYPLTKLAPHCFQPAKAERLPNSSLLKDLCIPSVSQATTLQLYHFSQVYFSHYIKLTWFGFSDATPDLSKVAPNLCLSYFPQSSVRQALASSQHRCVLY